MKEVERTPGVTHRFKVSSLLRLSRPTVGLSSWNSPIPDVM